MNGAFLHAVYDAGFKPPPDIRVRAGADVHHRFGVHRNNVMVSLVDALADTYPVVLALVGEPFFRAMAREHVRHYPPDSPVLAEYGRHLPEFLADFPPAAALPYLPDVARLEWARQVAMHAGEASALPADVLIAWVQDPEALAQRRWTLHPSLQVVRSAYPVVSIWAAHQHDGDARVAAALAGISPDRGESALIMRADWEVLVLPVTDAEAVFAQSLAAGATLLEAVDASRSNAGGVDIPCALALLLRMGAFT